MIPNSLASLLTLHLSNFTMILTLVKSLPCYLQDYLLDISDRCRISISFKPCNSFHRKAEPLSVHYKCALYPSMILKVCHAAYKCTSNRTSPSCQSVLPFLSAVNFIPSLIFAHHCIIIVLSYFSWLLC